LISTTRVNIGCSLHWLEGERNLRRRARRRTVFVRTKHATPLRLMGQLPGISAGTRLAQVDNAAVFSAYRIVSDHEFCVVVSTSSTRGPRLQTASHSNPPAWVQGQLDVFLRKAKLGSRCC
jgi:hypothetical protein